MVDSVWRGDSVVGRLLAAAAVAGPRFRLVVLAKVLELDQDACLAAVERAVGAGVLVVGQQDGEGWFADEEARRWAEGELTLGERTDLHRRFADVLESEPGRAHGQVTRHLSAALAATVDPVDRARLQLGLARAALVDGDLETARDAARAGVATARRTSSAELLADAALTLEPVGESSWTGTSTSGARRRWRLRGSMRGSGSGCWHGRRRRRCTAAAGPKRSW